MQTFLCDSFTFDDLTDEARSYLHDDYSLDCDSGKYKQAQNWAYAPYLEQYQTIVFYLRDYHLG